MVVTPKMQAIKAKIDKWNYSKLKSFCAPKSIINRMKKQHIEMGRIFANHKSDKG